MSNTDSQPTWGRGRPPETSVQTGDPCPAAEQQGMTPPNRQGPYHSTAPPVCQTTALQVTLPILDGDLCPQKFQHMRYSLRNITFLDVKH